MTWSVHQADCLEYMRGMPEQSVDAIIVDPPFGTTNCPWDSVIPFAPMWEQLKRIAKPRAAIAIFASQPFTSALVMSNATWFRYTWVWKKSRPNGFLDANRKPMKTHEDICVFGETPPSYYPQGLVRVRHQNQNSGKENVYGAIKKDFKQEETFTNYPSSVLDFPSVTGGVHPTQKSVRLLEYLIRTYTSDGETVLDFCAGSGSTGVACINTNRNFIGIEQDANYCEIARQRLANAAQQSRLELGI